MNEACRDDLEWPPAYEFSYKRGGRGCRSISTSQLLPACFVTALMHDGRECVGDYDYADDNCFIILRLSGYEGMEVNMAVYMRFSRRDMDEIQGASVIAGDIWDILGGQILQFTCSYHFSYDSDY